VGKKVKKRKVFASRLTAGNRTLPPSTGNIRLRRPPRAMVSVFATLGPRMVVKILLGCLGLMTLGVVCWIVILGELPQPEPIPRHGFETREVVLVFLAWIGLMALTEVGWALALHETRAWGRKPIKILWNAALVAFNALAILLVIDVFGLRLSGQNWVDLGFRPLSLRWFFGALGLGLLGMVLSGAVAALVIRWQGSEWVNPQNSFLSPTEQSTMLTSPTTGIPENEPVAQADEGARLSIPGALAMLLLVGMVVPLVEEMLFRGVLYTYLTEHLAVWVAVILSALAFGAAHWQSGRPVVAAGVVIGVLLALAFHYSHSLWAPVLIHAVNNLTKVSLTYLFRE
jgi:membrane protease YdiL (CAAX protease family)